MFFGYSLQLIPEANAEFIRLADQHVEVPGGKNVVPGEVSGEGLVDGWWQIHHLVQ